MLNLFLAQKDGMYSAGENTAIREEGERGLMLDSDEPCSNAGPSHPY